MTPRKGLPSLYRTPPQKTKGAAAGHRGASKHTDAGEAPLAW